MADISTFKDNADKVYNVKDVTARATAEAASTEAEYDRQASCGTYEGRSIIDVLGASGFDDAVAKLHAKAQEADGTLLRVMDYIDVKPTRATVNQGADMRYRIGAMGHSYKYGDTENPWAFWMVPDAPVDMTGSSYATNGSYIMWNTTNTNQGNANEKNPYLASNLHKWEIEQFLPALPASLQAVLVDHRAILEDRYSGSGKLNDSTGWSWKSLGKAFSLSETEVYDQCVWGTPGWSVGCDEQLPIFRAYRGRGMRFSRYNWWLRTTQSGSSSGVCNVNDSGRANGYAATNTGIRPLPCFLVG